MALTTTAINAIRDKFFWIISHGRFYIVEKSEGSSEYTSPTANRAVGGLRVSYTSKATHFNVSEFSAHLSDSSEIPSQFHEALCLKVIADGYKLPGASHDLQSAQYFDQQYEAQVREAKKFSKRNHITSGYIIPKEY